MTARTTTARAIPLPTITDVRDAAIGLDGIARRTPVLQDDLLDAETGCIVTVKAEFLQRGGAFKFRGLYNKVRLLSDQERSRGIVTLSSGNAGIAAAYAARAHQVPCAVVMPTTAAQHKVAAIEALGGRVIYHGTTSAEMEAKAREVASEGYAFVHPFDQPEVISGQATLALELLEQAPEIDAVIVAAGGGGMLAGIAIVLQELNPDLELIGVQPEGAANIYESLRSGTVRELENVATLADGLAVARCGQLTFELIQRGVNEIVLVSDDQILAAVAMYWRALHVAVEPAGAAALAAVLTHARFRNRRIAVVASGANLDPALLQHALGGRTAAAWKKRTSG
jgi:threonine dehydratase